MRDRRSAWPALISGVVGTVLVVIGLTLPWTSGRVGTELPLRALFPWDLDVPEVDSVLASIALPIAAFAVFAVLAIGVRVRWLAIVLAVVVLVMEVAWFASEAFRRTRGDVLVTDLELGAWLALGGALLVLVGALITPRWEPAAR